MMSQKHLHELLKEDQEPFHLKNYIADRRFQLNKSSPQKTHLQINKPKPFSQNSNFTSDFCKKACFLSFHESPDLRKSPLFQAALRIQNLSSSSKTKPQSKNGNAFGLFGSILKRLTHRNRNPKPETANGGSKVSVNEEKNEEKSMEMDLVTSCSCNEPEDFASFDRQFSQSPFRFVLKTSSPSRHEREGKENYELESLKRLQVEEEEEEEEKEQCSPVSVLDRPFEDDENDGDDDEIDFDFECSYAIVQRAKQQLLQNLRRFEELAEFDPIELEKRMVEQEQDDANDAFSSQCEMHIPGYNPKHIQDGMKRLVSDLIAEEETMQHDGCIDKQAAERVSKRLESWKDVGSNTIDMMVEQDFRRDQIEGWKGNEEQIRETGIEVGSSIFGLLMQELMEELVFQSGV